MITEPKEKWRQFKSLTYYRDEDVGGVLPLMKIDMHMMQRSSKMFSFEAIIWRERFLMKRLEKKLI